MAILIVAWGEEVLGGKILLLRKTHPVVVLWNKQASAVMTKRGQWIHSRPPLSLVPYFSTYAWTHTGRPDFQGHSNIPEGLLSLALVLFLDELEDDFAEAGCSASKGVLWLV